jgi:hypothetical protein
MSIPNGHIWVNVNSFGVSVMNYDSEFLFYYANVHQYPNTYLLCRIADIDQKMYVILIYHWRWSPYILKKEFVYKTICFVIYP